MTKFDTYQQVTDRIVAALETGTKPWVKRWTASGAGGFQMPHRCSGEPYRGINVLLLWIAYEERGFTGRHWLTFNQARQLGGMVRKGEKGAQIVFFKQLDVTDEGADGEERDRKVPMLRTYTVFNVDQVDGLPDRLRPAPIAIVAGKERDAAAEAALRSTGADIREGGDGAFYVPSEDYVQLPDFDRFHSTSGYLATLAHELCHWTGHTSRLDRAQRNAFGSKDYAAEELVAELGAAFVGARLGIAGEHIDNHAAYLASWLKALRGDKRAIFRAASAAQAAADLVLAKAGQGEAIAPRHDPVPVEEHQFALAL
jgi:antirestriction protein ArdC